MHIGIPKEIKNHEYRVALTPDGRFAYVTNSFTRNPGMVSVVDTEIGEVAATVLVNRNPNRVAVTPDGTTAYITNFRSWNVTVVDTATNEVTTAVRVRGRPSGIAVNPNGATYLYLSALYSRNQPLAVFKFLQRLCSDRLLDAAADPALLKKAARRLLRACHE